MSEVPINLDFDWQPLALLGGLALLALPLTGSASSWATLTLAGLAMGLIVFIIASGLTLVFGLMDVLNFGHGLFIAVGAFVATTVLGLLGGWVASPGLGPNLLAWPLPAWPACWPPARWACCSSVCWCARSTACISSRSSSPWAA
jgi:ABC-type branched-subunit amino acid transport system permease subunit